MEDTEIERKASTSMPNTGNGAAAVAAAASSRIATIVAEPALAPATAPTGNGAAAVAAAASSRLRWAEKVEAIYHKESTTSSASSAARVAIKLEETSGASAPASIDIIRIESLQEEEKSTTNELKSRPSSISMKNGLLALRHLNDIVPKIAELLTMIHGLSTLPLTHDSLAKSVIESMKSKLPAIRSIQESITSKLYEIGCIEGYSMRAINWSVFGLEMIMNLTKPHAEMSDELSEKDIDQRFYKMIKNFKSSLLESTAFMTSLHAWIVPVIKNGFDTKLHIHKADLNLALSIVAIGERAAALEFAGASSATPRITSAEAMISWAEAQAGKEPKPKELSEAEKISLRRAEKIAAEVAEEGAAAAEDAPPPSIPELSAGHTATEGAPEPSAPSAAPVAAGGAGAEIAQEASRATAARAVAVATTPAETATEDVLPPAEMPELSSAPSHMPAAAAASSAAVLVSTAPASAPAGNGAAAAAAAAASLNVADESIWNINGTDTPMEIAAKLKLLPSIFFLITEIAKPLNLMHAKANHHEIRDSIDKMFTSVNAEITRFSTLKYAFLQLTKIGWAAREMKTLSPKLNAGSPAAQEEHQYQFYASAALIQRALGEFALLAKSLQGSVQDLLKKTPGKKVGKPLADTFDLSNINRAVTKAEAVLKFKFISEDADMVSGGAGVTALSRNFPEYGASFKCFFGQSANKCLPDDISELYKASFLSYWSAGQAGSEAAVASSAATASAKITVEDAPPPSIPELFAGHTATEGAPEPSAPSAAPAAAGGAGLDTPESAEAAPSAAPAAAGGAGLDTPESAEAAPSPSGGEILISTDHAELGLTGGTLDHS